MHKKTHKLKTSKGVEISCRYLPEGKQEGTTIKCLSFFLWAGECRLSG